jgi:hypothetical protein
MSHTEFGGAVMMESNPKPKKDKKDTGHVRLSKDLVGKLNYIISVQGGSQDTFLDPLVRKTILAKFDELTARDPKRK